MNLASRQSEFHAKNGRCLIRKEMGETGCSGANRNEQVWLNN